MSPPVAHFLMEGPEWAPFRVHGHMEFSLKISGQLTSVSYTAPGRVWVELQIPNRDETAYFKIETKEVEVFGLLSTEKILNCVGSISILDLSNDLKATFAFDPYKDQRRGYLKSFFSKVAEPPRDHFTFEITNQDKDKLLTGFGSYLEHFTTENPLNGEQELLWCINDEHLVSEWARPPDLNMILPSDSLLREDVKMIDQGMMAESTQALERIRGREKYDQLLRKNAYATSMFDDYIIL